MSNFDRWWDFCQDPSRDGHANDGADDGAGITRWGWTWPGYVDARHYMGKPPDRASFLTLSQDEAKSLARVAHWARKGGNLLASGVDVVVLDWEWTSGGATREIQYRLGFSNDQLDGVLGPQTAHVINGGHDNAQFVKDCSQWREAYYDLLGYREQFPGLYTRTDAIKFIGLSLIKLKGDNP